MFDEIQLIKVSYHEYCRFHNLVAYTETFVSVLKDSGFPEYQKQKNNNTPKVYPIDTCLVEINTPDFTKDAGHKFENLVFLA